MSKKLPFLIKAYCFTLSVSLSVIYLISHVSAEQATHLKSLAQIVEEKTTVENEIEALKSKLAQTQTTLVQASNAENLAIQRSDQKALPVAREAVALARKAKERLNIVLQEKQNQLSALIHQGRQLCTSVSFQVKQDLEAVEQQKSTNELIQKEKETWEKLNDKAQKEAVMAAIKFTLGEFAAEFSPVKESTSKLVSRLTDLTGKATKSQKYQERLNYLSKLRTAMNKFEIRPKIIVNEALETDKAWNIARNTMKHEFRVARKHNENIRQMLEDSEFREAFTGDDLETPGLDVITALTNEAVEETAKFEPVCCLSWRRPKMPTS